MSKRLWYRIEAKADDPTVAELFIYDDIGKSFWDDDTVTAKQFIQDLQALSTEVKTVRVHVNSLGGDVFDAVAIANALRDQRTTKGRTVDVTIDGIAASAASIVIMAGSTIRIADNGLVMVHDPFTIGMGNAGEFRKLAETLDTIRDTIVATYKWRSPRSEDELRALMQAETWMDAAEAVSNGFATEVIEATPVTARFNARALARLAVPEKYRHRAKAVIPPTPAPPAAAAAADVLQLCREGGCLDVAEALIQAKASLEDVRIRVASEKQARAAEQARVAEITALCAHAKLSRLARGYIDGQMPVAFVKAHLTTITAVIDAGVGEIDGGLDPDLDARRPPRGSDLNPDAIYAARRPKSPNDAAAT